MARKKKSKRRASVRIDEMVVNPRKHYPPMEGRGRPGKKRKYTMTGYRKNGTVLSRVSFRATHSHAETLALAALKAGKAASIVLDDHRK